MKKSEVIDEILTYMIKKAICMNEENNERDTQNYTAESKDETIESVVRL